MRFPSNSNRKASPTNTSEARECREKRHYAGQIRCIESSAPSGCDVQNIPRRRDDPSYRDDPIYCWTLVARMALTGADWGLELNA